MSNENERAEPSVENPEAIRDLEAKVEDAAEVRGGGTATSTTTSTSGQQVYYEVKLQNVIIS